MAKKTKAPASTSFPVRIPNEDHQWLAALAKENGVEISQMIRWAVVAFRQYVEAHNGKLHLPIDIDMYYIEMLRHLPQGDKPPVFMTEPGRVQAWLETGETPPPMKIFGPVETDGGKADTL